MNSNLKISDKLSQNEKKISMKYRYDSNQLKGNRKILEAKLFSPQRRLNPNIYSNEIVSPSEYSLNCYPASSNYESLQKINLNYQLNSLRDNEEIMVNNFNQGAPISPSAISKLIISNALSKANHLNEQRKLESAFTAQHNRNEDTVQEEDKFNPRDSQTNYHKTRLPHINKEVAKLPISTKIKKLKLSSKMKTHREITASHQTRFIPQNEIAESSNNNIEYFKDNRNSVNPYNINYESIKRKMDEEVRESPTIKFDARKHSLNEPIHGKTTFANSKNTNNTNSCGKMKVYKLTFENNVHHPEQNILNGNPKSFIDSFQNQAPLRFNTNEAIKSLSPRKEAPKVIKKNKIIMNTNKVPPKITEYTAAKEDAHQATEYPLEPLTATIKKEKTQMKKRVSVNQGIIVQARIILLFLNKFIQKFDLLSNDISRNKNFSKTENMKFDTVNDRITQNLEPVNPTNPACTIYFQDNREMTVVNIVNQGPAEGQTIVKSKSFNPKEFAHRNHIQNTPYFGQKRANVYSHLVQETQKKTYKEPEHPQNECKMDIDPRLLTFHNEKGSIKEVKNQHNDEESDEDRYNEESFYDIQTESEIEKMKHTGTTKYSSTFKSTMKTQDRSEVE